jgi:hypothetical protein
VIRRRVRRVCAVCGKAVRRGAETASRGADVIHVKCVGQLRDTHLPALDWKSRASGERADAE